nr:hypothetical protein [Tanacetum cinerariifolium]
MGDGRTKRCLRRFDRIDMNELKVSGGLGEQIDPRLIDGQPVGISEILAFVMFEFCGGPDLACAVPTDRNRTQPPVSVGTTRPDHRSGAVDDLPDDPRRNAGSSHESGLAWRLAVGDSSSAVRHRYHAGRLSTGAGRLRENPLGLSAARAHLDAGGDWRAGGLRTFLPVLAGIDYAGGGRRTGHRAVRWPGLAAGRRSHDPDDHGAEIRYLAHCHAGGRADWRCRRAGRGFCVDNRGDRRHIRPRFADPGAGDQPGGQRHGPGADRPRRWVYVVAVVSAQCRAVPRVRAGSADIRGALPRHDWPLHEAGRRLWRGLYHRRQRDGRGTGRFLDDRLRSAGHRFREAGQRPARDSRRGRSALSGQGLQHPAR